eukprot:Awhi_evm1s2686
MPFISSLAAFALKFRRYKTVFFTLLCIDEEKPETEDCVRLIGIVIPGGKPFFHYARFVTGESSHRE